MNFSKSQVEESKEFSNSIRKKKNLGQNLIRFYLKFLKILIIKRNFPFIFFHFLSCVLLFRIKKKHFSADRKKKKWTIFPLFFLFSFLFPWTHNNLQGFVTSREIIQAWKLCWIRRKFQDRKRKIQRNNLENFVIKRKFQKNKKRKNYSKKEEKSWKLENYLKNYAKILIKNFLCGEDIQLNWFIKRVEKWWFNSGF